LSDSDSFISEVSEEVRRERFYGYLRRYGWIGAAVIALIVGAAGANEWLEARQEARAQEAGEALRAALVLEDPAERAERLAAFAGGADAAGVIARLAQAGALFEAGDEAGAAALLADLAEDGETPPLYRDLAALQRVAILGAEMPQAERMATLETLAAPGAPFRPLALEQRALAHLDVGDAEAAVEDLQLAIADAAAPESLRARARQLVIAAGGALPAEALPAPLPADG
jgi:hypothetical protein